PQETGGAVGSGEGIRGTGRISAVLGTRPPSLAHSLLARSLPPSVPSARPPAACCLLALARPPGFRRSHRKLRHSQSPGLRRSARALRSRARVQHWMLGAGFLSPGFLCRLGARPCRGEPSEPLPPRGREDHAVAPQ
ncbi:unnamed protein product, partial [Gulo gulo]